MKGIIRPCRHTVGRELHEQWRGHLCGLCLTLRDVAGQGARVLTGYDVLLPSVLLEAQAGPSPRTTAGPCPLRGFQTIEVVAPTSSAMQIAAAAALLTGAAGLHDKVDDGDVPAVMRPLTSLVGRRFQENGESLSATIGLDSSIVTAATNRALRQEQDGDASLDEILEPAGSTVALLFAQTATVAGFAENRAALGQVGDAFGRLVHLLDAVSDRVADRRHRRYNPLEATGTDDEAAGILARSLHTRILTALSSLHFADRSLVDALFGPTLAAAVDRAFPRPLLVTVGNGGHHRGARPERRTGRLLTIGIVAGVIARADTWGEGRRRRRANDLAQGNYQDSRFGDPRSSFGSGCGQLLACEACTDCCCGECCSGDCCCAM